MATLAGLAVIYSVAPAGTEVEQVLADDIDEVIITTAAADATLAGSNGGTTFHIPAEYPLVLKGQDYGGRSLWFDSAAGVITVLCRRNPVTD